MVRVGGRAWVQKPRQSFTQKDTRVSGFTASPLRTSNMDKTEADLQEEMMITWGGRSGSQYGRPMVAMLNLLQSRLFKATQ